MLAVYYGYRAPSKRLTGYGQMLIVGTLIAAAVTLLIVYGIAVTTGLGITNYFHAPVKGFQPADMSVGQHIRGHLKVFPVAVVLTSLLAVMGLALGKRRARSTVGQTA